MRDIHFRVDDDLYERWQNCAKHCPQGQRSHIMRKLTREAIEYMEKLIQPELELKYKPKPPQG